MAQEELGSAAHSKSLQGIDHKLSIHAEATIRSKIEVRTARALDERPAEIDGDDGTNDDRLSLRKDQGNASLCQAYVPKCIAIGQGCMPTERIAKKRRAPRRARPWKQ
jgi:hypothetical protein